MAFSRSAKPGLEALEARDCPAVRLGVLGNTLFVVGDAAANRVAITDNGAGAVTATADGRSVSGANITSILVDTQGGNDTFSYALTGALAGSRTLWVELGKGDDTGKIDATMGISSGALRGELQGGDGTDTLSAMLGSIEAGARANVEVNGGKGNDTINTVFSGELDGWLSLKGSGQDGEDIVTQNVALAVGSTGALDASVRGGKGNDRLTLNVTGDKTKLAFYEAKLDGDEGVDTFTATANVRVRNAEVKA